jgi:molecular chaperone GrpE
MMLSEEVLVMHCGAERDRRKYSDLSRAYQEVCAEAARLRERLARAEEEIQALGVSLAVLRRRLQSDTSAAREVGAIHAIRALLPVLDDLDRLSFHADLATDIQAVSEGVRMVHQNLAKTLEALGVRALSSVGSPFDPNLHEAIDRIESESHPDNTVAEEIQRGYEFKGTLIRAAKVRVAVQPASRGHGEA